MLSSEIFDLEAEMDTNHKIVLNHLPLTTPSIISILNCFDIDKIDIDIKGGDLKPLCLKFIIFLIYCIISLLTKHCKTSFY